MNLNFSQYSNEESIHDSSGFIHILALWLILHGYQMHGKPIIRKQFDFQVALAG